MTRVIPVVDVLHGQVVRAVRGDRRNYQPMRSPLCDSSDPLAVARILCARTRSATLYLADLDAIQAGARQEDVMRALLDGLPGVELWVDAGFADAAAARDLLRRMGAQAARVVPVFGSESMRSRAALEECFAAGSGLRATAALSLDRRGGQRLDAAGCWDASALWPQRVIVMTLERVGSDAGPDLDTIADVRRKAPWATVIGAGGVRHQADLQAADAAGADAWLTASALHDLRL